MSPQPSHSSSHRTAPHQHPAEEQPRRAFIVEFGAVAVGAALGLAGLLAGLGVFLDPVLRKKKAPVLHRAGEGGGDGFIRVATLDMVPDDGVPRRFPVIDNQIDAWTFSPNQRVGAVYLRRKPGEQDVQVFHTTCPHAGCAVGYVAERNAYLCPCHNSAFDLDGQRVDLPGKDNPSPRPLDELDVDPNRLAQSGEVWVRFLNFYTGIHEKTPKI